MQNISIRIAEICVRNFSMTAQQFRLFKSEFASRFVYFHKIACNEEENAINSFIEREFTESSAGAQEVKLVKDPYPFARRPLNRDRT
jgi:hypothetical protein